MITKALSDATANQHDVRRLGQMKVNYARVHRTANGTVSLSITSENGVKFTINFRIVTAIDGEVRADVLPIRRGSSKHFTNLAKQVVITHVPDDVIRMLTRVDSRGVGFAQPAWN